MSLPARLLPVLLAASMLPLSQMLFPGCATLVDGPRQKIRIATNPPRAMVYVDGKAIGPAPAMVAVSRWRSPHVRIEMPGFQPFDLQLEKQFNWDLNGNVFFAYVPIVIDAITGSMFVIEVPKNRRKDIVLQPWDQVEWNNYDRGVLFVGVELTPDSRMRKIGQLQRR